MYQVRALLSIVAGKRTVIVAGKSAVIVAGKSADIVAGKSAVIVTGKSAAAVADTSAEVKRERRDVGSDENGSGGVVEWWYTLTTSTHFF